MTRKRLRLNLRHHSKNGVGFEVIITVVMKSSTSGTCRRVVRWKSTDTSVQMARRIFGWPLAFTLVSCSAYSRTLKTEAICSFETSVNFQRTTRRYIPEDTFLHKGSISELRTWHSMIRQDTSIRNVYGMFTECV
jgi:hypothetical protein